MVGISATDVWAIQCKLISSGKNFSEDENCKIFRAFHMPVNVKKHLWVFRPRRDLTEVYDLRLPRPPARTAEAEAYKHAAEVRAEQIRRAVQMVTAHD